MVNFRLCGNQEAGSVSEKVKNHLLICPKTLFISMYTATSASSMELSR